MKTNDRERVKHGPHCRTHAASFMPNYGSDCTCGGEWSAERQLIALVQRELAWELGFLEFDWPGLTERTATKLVESGYVVAAPGTLAALAAKLEST